MDFVVWREPNVVNLKIHEQPSGSGAARLYAQSSSICVSTIPGCNRLANLRIPAHRIMWTISRDFGPRWREKTQTVASHCPHRQPARADHFTHRLHLFLRSEERRVGKEC